MEDFCIISSTADSRTQFRITFRIAKQSGRDKTSHPNVNLGKCIYEQHLFELVLSAEISKIEFIQRPTAVHEVSDVRNVHFWKLPFECGFLPLSYF